MSFFSSKIPRSNWLACLLRFLWAVTVPQTFLVIDDLDRVKEYRFFVECPSNGICLISFS